MPADERQKSETAFQLGLRDILLEFVAPVMIMFMLGSMFFYFLEILFHGDHQIAIHWVFGLYVFAIVLVGRVSIIEGYERANFLAIALILAVLFHTRGGPHLILVVLTWWAANKLTWDCTFIDESRDVTGQGLVSAAWDHFRGFWRGVRQVWRGEKSLATLVGGDEEPDTSGPMTIQSWMKQVLWKRKRKNTPGLWAFYFFVVGLFIFAAGQPFIGTDARARNYSLWAFSIYAFSGLGLMLFISLLGLMRYLRQRGTAMSDSIARSWLIIGLGLALLVVGTMYVLPWPNSGLSLSSLVPNFQTARRTGDRSPLTERGRADGEQGQQRTDPRGAPGQADQPAEREGRGGTPGGEKVGSQPQGKPGDTSGGNVGGGRGKQPASSQAKADQGNQQQQQSSSQRPQASGNQPQTSGDQQSQKSDGQQKSSGSQPQQSQKSQENTAASQQNQSTNEPKNSGQKSATQPPPNAASKSANSGQPNSGPPQTQNRSPAEQANSSRPSESGSAKQNAPQPAQKTPQNESSNWLANLWKMLGPLIGILLWIAALVVIGYLAIKYRAQIVEGLSAFLRSFSDWLSRLFQRKPQEASAGSPSQSVAAQIPQQPFSSYRNPFSDGSYKTRSPAELVDYTFVALEALARDAKLPRQVDETPIEFSRRLAERQPALRAAREFAELYSQAAYAGDILSAETVRPLKEFWSQMQSFSQQAARGLLVASGSR